MGAGAAFIMPATLSLLTSVFTDARERAMAIGIWAATAGVGVALGPVVGGFLLDHFWWGSVFIVNVPIVVAAIIGAPLLVPESREPGRAHASTGPARLLSGVGLVAFVWAIIEAPSKGWTSPPVLGALARRRRSRSVAFVVWERRVDEPLLDVRLFRNARFTAASITVTVLFFALFGFLFLSTQYLQFVLGYSPSAAGLRMLPYAGAMIVAAPLSSKLVARFGTKRVVTAGMLTFAAGLAIAATITTATGYGRLGDRDAASWASAWASPARPRPSRSWARSRPTAPASARRSTTRPASSAVRSASPSSAASCRRSTAASSPGAPGRRARAGRRRGAGVARRRGADPRCGSGAQVADAAREAFMHAMSWGSIVVACIAAAGALIAWRYLPGPGDLTLRGRTVRSR